MALVRELEDHGCDLKASILCKYTKQEVQRCNACEYKSMTDEERKQIVIDHYLNEGLLDAYPIEVGNEGRGLCLVPQESAQGNDSNLCKNHQQVHGCKKGSGRQRRKDQRR